MRPDRSDLIRHYDFPLDGFQLKAFDALDAGHSVLVAAPTGSGKTVVAEYAIEAARRAGRRAFYTAPIKALSNQKFHDLVERYGADEVGLLTGDNSINGDAPVVVMTTEVLRNMVYGRSAALDLLDVVVLDEVHFLQDTYRGPVWEEVIIHLPPAVTLVCLSATVSNAQELTDWIGTVRGPTTAVVEDRRPVRLEAARTVLAAGARLTTGDERDRIREIVDARLGQMEAADLAVLGYSQFLAQLEAGVAAHHAGMVPPFKEVVEACFVEGLVKVVFATETLAVGINMPAKCVVIEKLTKFTGDHHAFLTPGEYTQLTGRAGRRGIDDLGNAVVLWSPFVPFDQVAALASSRSFHLNSAFRPTYNMATNLVRTYSSERAHHLLNLSFAQYQADRDVVKIESRLERRQQHLRELLAESVSPFGDLEEYRRLLKRGSESAPASRHATIGRDNPIELALLKLKPGDIVYAEKGRYAGRVAVTATAHRKGGMRVSGITTRRDPIQLSELDFDEPPRAIGKIELPTQYAPNRHDFQKEIAFRLMQADVLPHDRKRRRAPGPDITDGHPVEDDPDLAERLKAAAQADRVAREVDELRQRMRGRSQSISRDFDRVLRILENWGYVDGWSLTEAGEILSRTFHECDLLIVECLRQGLLDDLDPATLAGLVSVFVYEHRSPEPPPRPWFPSPTAKKRWQRIAAISAELQDVEEEAGLALHRAPDPTFVAVAFAWAAGEGFAEVVEQEELSGGDFVRTTKQLIDVLRQLGLVAPNPTTRTCAQRAAEVLFRGVVSASSTVEVEAEADVEADVEADAPAARASAVEPGAAPEGPVES